MNWADYLIVILIALSMLIGLWRGLLREVISLVTWIAAFAIAFLFAEDGAAHLVSTSSFHRLRMAAAFGGLFLITLLIGGLIGMLASYLVDYTGLTGTDRLLGDFWSGARRRHGRRHGVGGGIDASAQRSLVATVKLLLGRFQEGAIWLRGFLPPELAQNVRFP
jgi:membrane protein required for colicin V production